ncbi:hypothetical protein [Micromonospora aurantiaca (nom. illeg.)]|uniref:hypothetical protein n=1 Tax=Micromonospora aurantiaca (nom. illeg.) TaxID=47850 RepID=UPI003F49DEB0
MTDPREAHPPGLDDIHDAAEMLAGAGHRAEAAEQRRQQQPGQPPAAPSLDDIDQLDEAAFWTARRALTVIRDAARTRLVSPWGTLGAVLAHVCSRIGPHVTLPAIVGGPASLNTFWALVGPSGGGKDAAVDVARELLPLADAIPTHEVGTGQGIDSAYTQVISGRPVQTCDACLLTASEIDTMAGHAAMAGSTIMATLRKVYSGSALGARYADKAKRRPVAAHHYRAALIVGVQPARSGVLLGDADGGTPQRFLWLPTNDPAAGADDPPIDPFPVARDEVWQRYSYLDAAGETTDDSAVSLHSRVEIKVCDTARAAIITNRRDRLAAPLARATDDLSGHALLTRLKVAALLGLLDGRAEASEEDWALASVVMAVSDETRRECVQALADAARSANVARGRQEAERADVVAEHAVKRVAAQIVKHLRKHGGWMAGNDLKHKIRFDVRGYFDEAVDRLHAAGQLDIDTDGPGTRYRAHDT